MSKVFYKYRGVANLERTLDIIVEGRLYAAQFTELNDPMEGLYLYDDQVLTELERARIKDRKLDHRIVSLSKKHTSTLMWSYYADGHAGIVIGVNLLGREAREIKYLGPKKIAGGGQWDEVEILCQKYKQWTHEGEYRVFIPHTNLYIQVEVKEIIFGIATTCLTKKIIRAVAEKFRPEATLIQLEEGDLEGLDSTGN
jgi:hypothetical protein